MIKINQTIIILIIINFSNCNNFLKRLFTRINTIIEIHHALSLVFQVIYELPTANQWCFDVQWCPRNPALLSAASFDGRISVYSVMGGRLQQRQHSTVDQVRLRERLTCCSLRNDDHMISLSVLRSRPRLTPATRLGPVRLFLLCRFLSPRWKPPSSLR